MREQARMNPSRIPGLARVNIGGIVYSGFQSRDIPCGIPGAAMLRVRE